MVSRVVAWHRLARAVNWNARNVDITDHGQRARPPRAKTEEVELVANVGCISVSKQFQRSSKRTSVLARYQASPCPTEEPHNTGGS